VHVNEDVLHVVEVAQGRLDLGKRRAAGPQVQVAAQVDHSQAYPVVLDNAHASSRLAAQEVGRTHDRSLRLQIRVDLPAMIGVVSQRDRIHARRKHLVGDLRRDAKTARRVLAVDHHERRRVALAQDRQAVQQRAPADAPDHVAHEQDAHAGRLAVERGVDQGLAGGLPHDCARLVLSHTLAMVAGKR